MEDTTQNTAQENVQIVIAQPTTTSQEEQMKSDLIKIPGRIKEKRETIFQKVKQLQLINQEIQTYELEIIMGVSSQQDPSGKKIYTNETQRQFAASQIKSRDANFIKMQETKNNLEEEIERLRNEVEYDKNVIEVYSLLRER